MGCSITLAVSNLTLPGLLYSYIELDGTVQETFPFGDGRKLFNPCKATDPLIENIWRTKIFESKIMMIHKVLPKFMKILSYEYLEPYGI